MRKIVPSFALGILSYISVVSAQLFEDPVYGINKGINQIIEIIRSLLYPIFFIIFGTDEFMFEKVLFLVLIFIVIFTVLSNSELFKPSRSRRLNRAPLWIISIAISILSTRFLIETSLFYNMILPYTVLGVVLITVIPLIIFFLFVDGFRGEKYSFLRKGMWILYAVMFTGMGIYRYDELRELSWIYVIAGFVALILTFGDRVIQDYKRRRKERQKFRKEVLISLKKQQEDLLEKHKHMDPDEFEKEYRTLLDEIDKV